MRVVPGCSCAMCQKERRRTDDLAARLARIVAKEVRDYVGHIDLRDAIRHPELGRIG